MNSDFTYFISEKIDLNTNIIWFEKSNKYIIINDLINNLLLNKINPYQYPINKDLQKVNQLDLKLINEDLKNLLKECDRKTIEKRDKELDLKNKSLKYHSTFKFNNRIVKIEYGNENLRNLVDPKFIHLESAEKESLKFRVIEKNKKIYLYKEKSFIGAWTASEMHEFQGKISMELTSFFHNMNDSNWTSVFHGSTLSRRNNCLMLTGDSGNGKSSLSTILMSNNYSLIADDFSPMDNRGIHYNFPSAISIKEGFYSTAENLFNSFKKLNQYYINDIKGNVKYLPRNTDNNLILSTRCHKIINVKFGENLKNEIKGVNKGKALQRILPDAWISKEIGHARSFIKWINSCMFYDLTYSNNEKAVEMINNIF